MILRIIFYFTLIFISSTSMSQVVSDTLKTNNENISGTSRIMPETDFPGGYSKWIEYLQNHLKANVPIKKGAPAGTYQVVVEFWIAEDGSIQDVSASTKFGFGMEEEAIRVIKKGPKWNPFIKNGKATKYIERQPITFVVPK